MDKIKDSINNMFHDLFNEDEHPFFSDIIKVKKIEKNMKNKMKETIKYNTFYEKYNTFFEYKSDSKNMYYYFIDNLLSNNSLCEDLSNYIMNVINLNEINVIQVFNYNFDFVYPNINNENNNLYNLFKSYKKYYNDNKTPILTQYYNLVNHENYFYWIESCIKNKSVSIISPKTGKIITTDKYFIIMYEHNCDKYLNSIVNYYFEEEDIVLGLGLGTGNFLSTMETRILYIYNHHELVLHYSYENMGVDIFKQKIFPLIIKNMTKMYFEKEAINKYKSQVITLYGYIIIYVLYYHVCMLSAVSARVRVLRCTSRYSLVDLPAVGRLRGYSRGPRPVDRTARDRLICVVRKKGKEETSLNGEYIRIDTTTS
jgi:hypothetical protein